jgi:hypothetical protein
MAEVIRCADCGASHFIKNAARLFRTPQHVVDQRSVDVGATGADRVEEQVVIGYEVPMVNQFFEKDLFVAGLAQHHQST